MKRTILDISGNKKQEKEMPSCFEEPIREDLIMKSFRVSFLSGRKAYGSWILAGKEMAAHGKASHMRNRWKTQYGHGISRAPRKIMSRDGDRFNWVGAFASGTRGGREAHPPKAWKRLSRKISEKERNLALRSAISLCCSLEYLKRKYSNLNGKDSDNLKSISLPIIVESKINDVKKTKDILEILKKILSGFFEKVKDKRVLIVTNNDSNLKKINIIDSTTPQKINILKLVEGGNPGRIIVFTEDAIDEMLKTPKFK